MNFLNEFLERNKVYLSPPYYAKTQNYWELSFNNEQRLFYFVEENDFIGEYKDSLMDKPTRKRFEKAEDYFKWWEEMKQTFNQRERIKLRRERDEMRKT